MNLTGIIAISGKPGLFKVVTQGKNNIIVESLEDKKRVPAYASDKISALDDISIYTSDEDKPLREIFSDIYKKEKGAACISHKEDAKKLETYLTGILPNYDKERVYLSDIKKIYQWYNLLHKANMLIEDEVKEDKAPKKTKKEDPEAEKTSEKPAKKVAAVKKAVAPKKATEKSSAKPASAKKAPVAKTGAARGK